MELCPCIMSFVLYCYWTNKRNPGFLTLYEDGLVLQSNGTICQLSYKDIGGLALNWEARHKSRDEGWTLDLALWKEPLHPSTPFCTLYGTYPKHHHRLDDVIHLADLLTKKMTDIAERKIADGGMLQGEAFELTSATLGLGAMRFPLKCLTAVAMTDGKLKIWAGEATVPIATLSIGELNVSILARLLDKQVGGKECSIPGLGRLLFERFARNDVRVKAAITLIGALGIFYIVQISDVPFYASVLSPLVALVLSCWNLSLSRMRFQCYENGITYRTLLSTKELLFSEARTFIYECVKHYTNGQYSGVQLRFALSKTPRAKRFDIDYSCITVGEDNDLDQLRDVIAGEMSKRIVKAVKEGNNELWWKHELTPDGLQVWSKEGTKVIPYDRFREVLFEHGKLFLYVKHSNTAAGYVECGGDNFFPGFWAFKELVEENSEELTVFVSNKPPPAGYASPPLIIWC